MFLLTALPFMYCDAASTVAAIRRPADATHAGAGSVTLASGANFEVTKDEDRFLVTLRHADRVQLCYAPAQKFADAGPTARMAIAGNARTGDYFYTLAYPAKTAAAHAAHAASTATAYTMLVPTTFDGTMLGQATKNVYVTSKRSADRYRIEVDLAPQCDGANVCSAGSFSGYGASAFAGGLVKAPPDGPLSRLTSQDESELRDLGASFNFERACALARDPESCALGAARLPQMLESPS